jgi:hypothetical protein
LPIVSFRHKERKSGLEGRKSGPEPFFEAHCRLMGIIKVNPKEDSWLNVRDGTPWELGGLGAGWEIKGWET